MEINNEEKIDGGKDKLDAGKYLVTDFLTQIIFLIYFLMKLSVSPANDDDFGGLLSANLILLRNRLLDNLLRLLFTTKEKCSVNAQ